MTGEELLRTHRPVVKYDSQESYFADSAATFTDSPGNRLRRAAGAVHQPTLNLAFLGKTKYADGKPAAATDKIGDPNPKEGYRERARKMHEKPGYANRVYGRVGTDRNGEQWLQYWLFYYYNDYNLIGGFLKAGLHEGDWEGIQIRVRDGKPDVAVFAQHANAQARDWRQVDIAAGTKRPIVYVARGSHASYFEPGTHWTGHWFDHADGKRRSPELTLEIVDESDPAWSWISWPGRWGDTKKGDSPLDTPSPDGPGAKKHWKDPLILAEKADETLAEVRPRRPSLPSPPHVIGHARRRQAAARVRDGRAARRARADRAHGHDQLAGRERAAHDRDDRGRRAERHRRARGARARARVRRLHQRGEHRRAGLDQRAAGHPGRVSYIESGADTPSSPSARAIVRREATQSPIRNDSRAAGSAPTTRQSR